MPDLSEPTVGWDPRLRTEAGQALAAIVRRHPSADAVARTLAPDGAGPGVRFNRYEGSLASPRAYLAYQKAFPDLASFLGLLEEGDPGAIELGLELVGRLEPEACVPIAELLLANTPWKFLGAALGRALGACASERSFVLLLEHRQIPYLPQGLATHRYPGGVDRAWNAYRAYGDVARADLPPVDRVRVLPLLSYLLAWDPEPAFVELVRLSRGENHEVQIYAAHGLFNHASGHAVLLEALSATAPGERLSFVASMGVRVLLHRDASTTIDALGGVEHLLSPGGRPRLVDLLNRLTRDTFPSGGEKTTGLLPRDPRFAELLAAVRADRDRELVKTAGDLLGALPPALRPKVAKPKAPPMKKPVKKKLPKEPDAALLREMERHRAALESLVAHLRSIGYQFVNPKGALKKPTAAGKRALAQLEKALGPLPVALVAFYRGVGSVDLRGQDPSWPRPACLALPGVSEGSGVWLTDPLMIAPPEVLVEQLEDYVEGTPLGLVLAPDAIGKAGYSGGTLVIDVPSELDDPRIQGGTVAETLREHLARAIASAGMPGLLAIPERPEAWLASARAAIG